MKEKEEIKKQLRGWGYNVRDMANIMPGNEVDLIVDGKWRLKIVKLGKPNQKLIDLNKAIEEKRYDAIAGIIKGQKLYAGGKQTIPLFTAKHKDVLTGSTK